MKQIFIDGSAGTTGLNLQRRLQQRKDVTLIALDKAHRKDPKARKQAIEQADVIVLCLPDEAAKEAVELAKGCKAVILDASTAHRTAPGWVYGLPELSGQHWQKVQNAQRIAVPGCHASGFIALVQPLRAAGLLPADAILHCHSITGYSGGGKAMIAQYEQGFCSAAALSGRDDMELTVHGCQDRILLVARYDNLGKGACGAALECINLVLGTQHTTGLVLGQQEEKAW